jgi:hypothetical protein
MAHPIDHAKTAAKRWGGTWEEYIVYEEWFDETKAWIGHSYHRMFRHHSEGIFQLEEIFGKFMINSIGKRVYIRYIGEQHVKEDCNNHIPSAKEWLDNIVNKTTPLWMIKTLKIED